MAESGGWSSRSDAPEDGSCEQGGRVREKTRRKQEGRAVERTGLHSIFTSQHLPGAIEILTHTKTAGPEIVQ